MTKIEIQEILLTAETKSFLDAVEYLAEQERNYRKSAFYKKTQIPLFTLYEKYLAYKEMVKGFDQRFEDFILGLDLDLIQEKIIQLVELLSNNKEMSIKLDTLLQRFDLSKIVEDSEELDKLLKKIKN